ncbi:MAG: hypothetical protein OEV00_01900, partial [Acidobacteriota bacterium]|nr:hypothetical protein [Acidobacteriota bacterium]
RCGRLLDVTDVANPFLIRTATDHGIVVEHNGVAEGALATLDVTYANSQTLSVALTGTLTSGVPGRVDTLQVEKIGSALQLTWGEDCGGGDRYGVYRGDLSVGYNSLTIESCDISGTTTSIPVGAPAGEFFLIVPVLGTAEGSYGRDGACGERPDALASCHPQTTTDPCAASCGGL